MRSADAFADAILAAPPFVLLLPDERPQRHHPGADLRLAVAAGGAVIGSPLRDLGAGVGAVLVARRCCCWRCWCCCWFRCCRVCGSGRRPSSERGGSGSRRGDAALGHALRPLLPLLLLLSPSPLLPRRRFRGSRGGKEVGTRRGERRNRRLLTAAVVARRRRRLLGSGVGSTGSGTRDESSLLLLLCCR